MPAVIYEKRERIAYLTLNRPESLNAFNREMHQQLREAWLDFRADDDVWVAVVTGAGDRAFSPAPTSRSWANASRSASDAASGRRGSARTSKAAWRCGSRPSPLSTATAWAKA